MTTHHKCPADCGHSDLEHHAFDRGFEAGEKGVSGLDNPYRRNSLRDAWESGRSAGAVNREAQDRLNARSPEYVEALNRLHRRIDEAERTAMALDDAAQDHDGLGKAACAQVCRAEAQGIRNALKILRGER